MKTAQLQIRLTPAQKAEIERSARKAGLGMSAYVLGRMLPGTGDQWRNLAYELAKADDERLALAALSGWLANLDAGELADALEMPPPAGLSEQLANTVAAMIEHVCVAADVNPPAWTRDIPPLSQPVFGSGLTSL